MIYKYLTILAASFLFILTENAAAQGPSLPIIELKAGMYRIEAELADTPAARQTGLMYRTFMPTNTGMLFVFPEKAIHCFWMRNTKLPLTIAFIDDDGEEELFAHFSAITMSGFKTLKEGQKVTFDITQGPKGKQATNIQAA